MKKIGMGLVSPSLLPHSIRDAARRLDNLDIIAIAESRDESHSMTAFTKTACNKLSRSLHYTLLTVCCVLSLATAGCRQDMQDQPKFYLQRGSGFYADGRSVRPRIPNTVARSDGDPTDYVHTGLIDGKETDNFPIPLTEDVMKRGQERYNIYCSPCHSHVGNGLGRIVERGYHPATSFHSTRLRDAPLGHFVQVMTHGYGAMPNYAAEIAPQDRWAIAAYIRALQLSQNAKQADISVGEKPQKLEDIQMAEGFSKNFLEPWFPIAHTHTATDATPSTAHDATIRLMPETVALKPLALAALSHPTTQSRDSQTTETTSMKAPTNKTETGPSRNPIAGKTIYMNNCVICHQVSRGGMPPSIPSLIGIVPKDGEERIRFVISNGIPTGRPPMPAFASLSTDDIENLIAFLNTSN